MENKIDICSKTDGRKREGMLLGRQLNAILDTTILADI
jgi:hypothetical protein